MKAEVACRCTRRSRISFEYKNQRCNNDCSRQYECRCVFHFSRITDDIFLLSTMEFFTNDLARPCCSLLANRNGKKLQRRCTPSLAVNKQRNEPRENTNDREKKQYPYYSRLQNLFVDPRCLRSISGFTITRVETPRSRIYLLV